VTRRPPAALWLLAAAVTAVLALPLVYLVVRVLGAADPLEVLGRPRTLGLVLRTVALTAAVTTAASVLGVGTAWLVTRTDLPLRRTWTVVLALPLVMPSYVLALALLASFGQGGFLQELLGVGGGLSIGGFGGAFVALTLATYPYVMLLCAAALRRSDRSLEEAARSLGQGRRQVFRRVTLPAIRPSIAASGLLVALYTISDFGVVSLMRYDALTRAIYSGYRAAFDRTPAAVLGLLLVALTAVILIFEAKAAGRARASTAPGDARPAAPAPLGRLRPVALGLCGTLAVAALVLPVAVLVWWTARPGGGAPAFVDDVLTPGLNSVGVSVAAALLATLAALPVAVLAVRFPRRSTRALDRVAFAANALPGVVIGLALVFFAARYVPALYGTLAVLMVAYVVRFLPQALSGARTALQRVDPSLEEASRGLGRGPLSTLTSVTAPLVAPGLLAGATLVFISTMKELPATLLLRPIGFETLPTEVWTATGSSSFSEAAPAALLLILLAAPVVWLGVVRGGRDPSGLEA
jgi:iron(III) transport system permease protein